MTLHLEDESRTPKGTDGSKVALPAPGSSTLPLPGLQGAGAGSLLLGGDLGLPVCCGGLQPPDCGLTRASLAGWVLVTRGLRAGRSSRRIRPAALGSHPGRGHCPRTAGVGSRSLHSQGPTLPKHALCPHGPCRCVCPALPLWPRTGYFPPLCPPPAAAELITSSIVAQELCEGWDSKGKALEQCLAQESDQLLFLLTFPVHRCMVSTVVLCLVKD